MAASFSLSVIDVVGRVNIALPPMGKPLLYLLFSLTGQGQLTRYED